MKPLHLFLIPTILLFTNITSGQGTIRGSVSDSLSGESLVGANVFLTGTAIGSATNIEGEFVIPSVPQGNYKLKISYIGYKSKEFDIQVADNKTITLDVDIVADVVIGEEVLVTGQASGQISAINQQRSSNTIINVVSEEKIKELPDANAAESIGRLPGVSILRSGGEANKVILRGLDAKFVNITIDGIKIPPTDATSRGVDLSMLSQNSLAGIELYKAITSDMDGDALAGSINLVTKKAPEKREIRADLKGGYNSLMESFEQYDFALHYGERFFNDILGVQVTGNIENKVRSNERINTGYLFDQPSGGEYNINNFTLEYTDEIRKRNGLSLFLDFNTPDEGIIRLNNVYSITKRDYFLSTRDYPVNGGGPQQGHPLYDYRDTEQEIGTFNSSIQGENHLFTLDLNWGVSFAQSESSFPYDYELLFVEDGAGMIDAPVNLKDSPEKLIPYAANNFSIADLDWAYFRNQENFDKERTAFLDISKPYVFGNLFSGQIKIGGKYKIKERTNARTEDLTPYYLGRWMTHERLPDGTFRSKDFTGTFLEDWWRAGGGGISVDEFFDDKKTRDVYDSYLLNPLIESDRLRQWWDLNRYGVNSSGSYEANAQEVWNNPLIEYDDHDVTERISAAYLMNTLNIGQFLTVIAGIRVEQEDNDYIGNYMPGSVGGFPVTSNSIKDTSSSAKQTVVLPNVNISYRPLDFFTLRIAAYKTLTRPDFNMRIDRYIAGRPAEVSSRPQVYVGNINLRTAEAWNFEVNTSFYGNEIGLISLSAYYKEIKNMYHMLNNFNTEAVRDDQGIIQDTLIQFFGIKWPAQMQTTPYDLTLPYNSPDPTKVWGFEFEHQINFHFLPGLLKNIVLSYNASIVRSETVIYGSRIERFFDSTLVIPRFRTRNILITTKQKLEGMPEFFGNISLGYDIAGFSGRVSLFHKGEHNVSFSASGSSDQVTKPFTRIDVALKQEITSFLSVFINLNNVTDIEDAFNLSRRDYGYKVFDQSEKYGFTADLGVTVKL